MNGILRKLTSRKLWLAVAGIVTGIALALGVEAGEIGTAAGAVLSVVSVVTYIVTEGKVDAEAVKHAVTAVEGAAGLFAGEEGEE